MSVAAQSTNLVQDEKGIWISNTTSSLSYPEDGNKTCFQLEDDSFWFKHRNRCILSVVKRFPPRGPVLDVGGGNGYVTRHLLDHGFPATLLEPGPVGALNAKTTRQIPEVICSTLENAGFPEQSLSAIGLFDVLEHIEDDHAFIDNIYRLLLPGGLLYATVPANQRLWSLSDVTAEHFRRYDKAMLTTLITPNFECLYLSCFFRPLGLPLFLLRTLPFKLGLTRKKNVLASQSEHGSNGGIFVRWLSTKLDRETLAIEQGRQIPTGTSCLMVARAKPGTA